MPVEDLRKTTDRDDLIMPLRTPVISRILTLFFQQLIMPEL